jgi:tripartite-type tricarboxylate transporter receptor subunit TctC
VIDRRALLAILITSGPQAAHPLRAQSCLTRPIRLIVPFPPGGPTDVMGRLIGQQLSASFGPIVVDNQPGAGSTLGAKLVASAGPDGYTLLFGNTVSLAIGPALYKSPGYDPINSFARTATISDVPYIIVISPTLSANTVKDIVAYGRANSGKLNFGASGGTPAYLLTEVYKRVTNTDLLVVPYRGGAAEITDLVGGQLQGTFETPRLFSHTFATELCELLRSQAAPGFRTCPTSQR